MSSGSNALNICHTISLWMVLTVLVYSVEPSEEEVELPSMVVTAKSLVDEEEVVPVPGNDTVITREEIEDSGADSVAELLAREAGLPFSSFFGNPALGTPVLRGFAENASSRTLILVDGLPVSRSDLGASPWYQFPLASLEQVELMRGSRTVRYGSAALAGVISLETRRYDGEFGGFLESRYGSDDAVLYQGALHLPLGLWELAVQGEDSSGDGYRQNSGYDSTAWNVILSSPKNERFEGRWMVSGNDLMFENPGALSEREYRDDPRQSRYERFGQADQFFNEIESLRASQHLKWHLGSERMLSLAAAWFERERELNFGPGSHSDNDLDSTSFELVLSDKSSPFSWELGARAQRDKVDLARYQEIERQTSLGDAALGRDVFGFFALGSYELRDDWRVSGGIGWESYELDGRATDARFPTDPLSNFSDSRRESDTSAELSIEYVGGECWSSWLRYDRVYRFPVMDEIAAYQGFLLAEPFNLTLEPERGHALEIGTEYVYGGIEFGVTAFAHFLEGEIAYDYLVNNNVNFADTRRLGIELNARYESEYWSALFNYTGISAEYDSGEYSGNRIPLIPKHTLSGAVTWNPRDDLALTLEGRYLSSSPEGNDYENQFSSLPSSAVFNAQCRWEVRENMEVFMRVNNLLDREYATLKFVNQWYPAPGRQIMGGVKWKF